MLPIKNLQNQYKLHWKPIYTRVNTILKDTDIDIGSTVDSEKIYSCYSIFISNLRDNFKYIFSNKKCNPENQLISTWANKTSYSSVDKLDTANNKSNLYSKKKSNNTRNFRLKRTRNKKEHPLYQKRQEIRIASLNDSFSDINTTSNKSNINGSIEKTQNEIIFIKLLNIG